MSGQHGLVGVTRIRTPLIGMMEEPLSRPPPRQRHLERRDDEMPVVAGGALGLVLAQWLLWALLAIAPPLPRVAETALDIRALGFAFLISGVSTVLFGLLPAWYSTAPNLSDILRSAGSHGGDRPG